MRTISNPNAELSIDQRSTIVKLLNSKAVVLADELFDHDGEAVLFEDDSPITFGDLMFCEAIDPAKPVGPGNRHYPVVCGLTKGQASGAIQALLEFPNKPKAYSGNRRNSAKPSTANSAKPNSDLTAVVAETVMGVLGQLGLVPQPEAPAKPVVKRPVPAEGHSKPVADPAKPVAAVPIKLAEGQIIEWDGQLYELTRQANGRIGQRRIEA